MQKEQQDKIKQEITQEAETAWKEQTDKKEAMKTF